MADDVFWHVLVLVIVDPTRPLRDGCCLPRSVPALSSTILASSSLAKIAWTTSVIYQSRLAFCSSTAFSRRRNRIGATLAPWPNASTFGATAPDQCTKHGKQSLVVPKLSRTDVSCRLDAWLDGGCRCLTQRNDLLMCKMNCLLSSVVASSRLKAHVCQESGPESIVWRDVCRESGPHHYVRQESGLESTVRQELGPDSDVRHKSGPASTVRQESGPDSDVRQ